MRVGWILGAAIVGLSTSAALPALAQDSLIMQELDRRQEQLLRELEARQRRQDLRRGLEREAERREEMRREDLRREDLRRDDLRREQDRAEERRRQMDEDARRAGGR